MPKEWGVKGGRVQWNNNKRHNTMVGGIIENKDRPRTSPQQGIKLSILDIYDREGKLAAWKALESKKLGYTLEMFERWIEEYEKRKKVVEKDDGAR